MSNQTQNNSDILNLESLIKQYDTLLIQYNQVQTDYINYLKSGESNSDLVSVKGSTYWGQSSISSSNVANVRQCSALCSSTKGCSGATYNINSTTQNNCFLRSGDGEIIAGTGNQYAIIPQKKEYLTTLQKLNSQLLQVNNEIVNFIQTNKNIFTKEDNKGLEKYNLLNKNYEHLKTEGVNILNQLSQFQSIDEIQNQSELVVNKNYSIYVLLMFVVFICIFIVSKIVIGSNDEKITSNMSAFALIFAVFIIVFIIFLIIRFFQRRQINFF